MVQSISTNVGCDRAFTDLTTVGEGLTRLVAFLISNYFVFEFFWQLSFDSLRVLIMGFWKLHLP